MLENLIKYNLYRTTHNSQAGVNAALAMPEFKIHPDDRERLKMARGRKPNINQDTQTLISALSFVSIAQTKDRQHVSLGDGWAVMSNGQVSAGHPITSDINCNPLLPTFLAALKKCGKSLSMTLLETMRLSIKGDALRCLVPCLQDHEIMLPKHS